MLRPCARLQSACTQRGHDVGAGAACQEPWMTMQQDAGPAVAYLVKACLKSAAQHSTTNLLIVDLTR